MRTLSRLLFAFLVLTLSTAGLESAVFPAVKAQQTFPDDEIAFINANSFIQIIDPFTPSGRTPFNWISPVGGWTDLVVLDSNGDRIPEILAIGGGTARLFAPYTPSGIVPPGWTNQLPAGFVYTRATAGDLIPGDGGRDEIVLHRTDNRGGGSYSLQIYDGDNNGTTWQLVYEEFFAVPWIRMETGDYNGLEGEELILVRNGLPPDRLDRRIKILARTPAGTFQTFAEQTYNFPWIDLAVGNTHTNNGNLAEIVLTRDQVLGVFPSYLVFQYAPPVLIADAPTGERKFYPPFFDIALGDTNASGDAEVFLIRDPLEGGTGISLIGINHGSDPFPADWENGVQLGRNLQAVAMGDVDGDGRAEVVVAQPGSYRIWLEPASSLTNSTGWITASFQSPIVLRTGNFDGDGISFEPPRLAVDKTGLTFGMLRGGANPPSQTFQVTNAGGGGAIAYEVAKERGSAWLQVTPFEGTTPTTHTVTINGQNLPPGTYTDTIIITAVTQNVQDSPRRISVTLTVTPTGPELGVQPSSLHFDYNYGGIPPAAQTLSIRNVGDGGAQNYRLTVTTADGGNWLRTDKSSGRTDDTVSVSIDPTNLRPGDYSGRIRVDAGAIRGSPVEIPVTLRIAATGMIVTPTNLIIVADPALPSPRPLINVDQAVPGQGAIHWYAYAVLSGDWWDMASRTGEWQVTADKQQLRFTAPDGTVIPLSTVPWVILTPNNGYTPGSFQVSLDVAQAPRGETRVTILVDGGPGTPGRFQGVDVRVNVNNGGAWLPLIRKN